jgi:hypothetical protein
MNITTTSGVGWKLVPIALLRELVQVTPHLLRVQLDLELAHLVRGRLVRFHVGVDGRLGIDHDLPVAGKLHDEVGAQLPILSVCRLLLDEVAVRHHPGHLDHAPQLDLAPAAAHVRLAQRLHEVAGLLAQLGLRRRHLRELLADLP